MDKNKQYPNIPSCFVESVIEPIHLVDVRTNVKQTPGLGSSCHVSQFTDHEEMRTYFKNPETQDYLVRFMYGVSAMPRGGPLMSVDRSINQRNSWAPLQITSAMANEISSQHGLSPAFTCLMSCFYQRNIDVEESLVAPFKHLVDDYGHGR